MANECLVYNYARTAVAGSAGIGNIGAGHIRVMSGTAGNVKFQLGAVTGDVRSTKNGCCLWGYTINCFTPSSRGYAEVYGSAIFAGDLNSINYFSAEVGDVIISNSMLAGGVGITNGASNDYTLRNVVLGNDEVVPIVFVTPPPAPTMENVVITDTGAAGIFPVSADVILGSLKFSGSVIVPPINSVSSSVQIDDLEDDVTMSNLVAPASGSTYAKRYTFNPTIVEPSLNSLPVAVSGATVSIFKLPDAQYVRFNTTTTGTYTITINGVAINFAGNVASGTTRTNAVTAINAAAVPVTAYPASNGSQITGSSVMVIHADVAGTPFTVELTSAPGGTWDLNPGVAGNAADVSQTYQPGAITGSPFTTDSNGQIASGAGVKLPVGLYMEATAATGGPISISYRVVIEAPGYETADFVIKPTAAFRGNFPLIPEKMGSLR